LLLSLWSLVDQFDASEVLGDAFAAILQNHVSSPPQARIPSLASDAS
jgi:hypothetical protein